jgi:hypothetical protein
MDKSYLKNLFGENLADFLENEFKDPSEYDFLNKYIKNFKKQISLSIDLDKVSNDEMSIEDFEKTLKSDIELTVKYKGVYVSGQIEERYFYEMISFFNCNVNPKLDTINNSLLFENSHYRIFVNNIASDRKNVAILFKHEDKSDIESIIKIYFSNSEIKDLDDDEVLKLSYDTSELEYQTSYYDYNTGSNLIDIQDALHNSYAHNPIDYLLTLGLIYKFKNLGWDKNYINFIASNNRAFNILNSKVNISLSRIYIEYLSENKYIDGEDYSLTEMGRTALSLLNYIVPMESFNYSNFFVSISNMISSQTILKENMLSISTGNSSLFGIRDEFFVDETALMGMATGMFSNDANYSLSIANSVSNLKKAKAVGYTSNISFTNTLDFEICQELFNTFNNDMYNVIGGLVAIKTYNSIDTYFVNSLIYRLLSRNGKITPYISESNKSFVIFKNASGNIIGIVKTKDFSCHKDYIGTQDISLLINKISKTYSVKLNHGINYVDETPTVLGEGYVEKAEISIEDFNKMILVPFKELRSTLNLLNKDNYFSELNETEVLNKIIDQRKSDYHSFVEGVKDDMRKKLKAVEIIYNYFVSVGNEDKKSYYADLIQNYNNKIDNFRI